MVEMELYEQIVRQNLSELEKKIVEVKASEMEPNTWEFAWRTNKERDLNELELRASSLRDVITSAEAVRKIVSFKGETDND